MMGEQGEDSATGQDEDGQDRAAANALSLRFLVRGQAEPTLVFENPKPALETGAEKQLYAQYQECHADQRSNDHPHRDARAGKHVRVVDQAFADAADPLGHQADAEQHRQADGDAGLLAVHGRRADEADAAIGQPCRRRQHDEDQQRLVDGRYARQGR